MLVKEAVLTTGGLSEPSKMPGYSFNLPARACKTGAKLRNKPGCICGDCYACKNHYAWDNVQGALERRLASLNNRGWVGAMAFLINRYSERGHSHFRWHDSGDLQSTWHLDRILEVCRRTPEVEHWMPTKEYAMARRRYSATPRNLTIRLSAHYINTCPVLPVSWLGLDTLISMVHTQEEPVKRYGAFICPAKDQDGECGSCRACWQKDVKAVSYLKH